MLAFYDSFGPSKVLVPPPLRFLTHLPSWIHPNSVFLVFFSAHSLLFEEVLFLLWATGNVIRFLIFIFIDAHHLQLSDHRVLGCSRIKSYRPWSQPQWHESRTDMCYRRRKENTSSHSFKCSLTHTCWCTREQIRIDMVLPEVVFSLAKHHTCLQKWLCNDVFTLYKCFYCHFHDNLLLF